MLRQPFVILEYTFDPRIWLVERAVKAKPAKRANMEMNAAVLRDICTQNKLYRTPYLNDKLYLNYKGFTHIAGLDQYINLKALFLEGNALQTLEGLPTLELMRCLYVHQNRLRNLHGLERLANLDTLNVSSNGLDTLENIQSCPLLSTLIAEHNRLSTPEALAPLSQCPHLHTLDLQNNNIENPAVVDAVTQLPELRCLYLKGNPVVSKVPSYRKYVISKCKLLTYLDDRPVTEEERKCCEAWACGGLEAERAERIRLKEEAAKRDRKNFEWLQQLRKEGFRKRRAMLGLPEGDTDPFFDTLKDQDSAGNDGRRDEPGDDGAVGDSSDSSSDTEYEFENEPPELLIARQQLAAYTARPGEEEPPELSAARRKMAQQGQPIQEGRWSQADDSNTATATAAPANCDDGLIYLASVKASQEELDRAGGATSAASGGAVAALGSPAAAGSGNLNFSRLRAAREAALAAVGLTDGAAVSISSPGLQRGASQTANNSGSSSDTGASTDKADTGQDPSIGGLGTPHDGSAHADHSLSGEEHEAHQGRGESHQQPSLCMSGSWSSRSSEDAAGKESAESCNKSTAVDPRAEPEGSAAEPYAIPADVSQHGVSLEDVVLTTEHSAAAPYSGVHGAGGGTSAQPVSDNLYDLD